MTESILAALISGYLLWRAGRPGQPPRRWWLISFFCLLTAFLTTLLLESALLPTPRLSVVFAQNSLLAGALVCLLQFAYQFPEPLPSLRREARLALAFSSLYTLWEVGLAGFRFAHLRAGEVVYRPNWSDYLLLLGLLWAPWAFFRQSRALAAAGRAAHARNARAFGLIFLFAAGLSAFNIMRANYLLSVTAANAGLSLGILSAVFLFAITYLNSQPETASLVVRIVGATLTTMLAILGALGWVISPVYENLYHPPPPDQRSLRFTPNALGGYDIAEKTFAFETDLGRNLQLDDGPLHGCGPALAFAFPFYGQTQTRLYACNDGVISLGRPATYRAYQYHYGAGIPLILAGLIDLDPRASAGGVFVRQTPERLVVTWQRLRGFRLKEAEFTFQAVLYPDGAFDLNYNGLPASLPFLANDDPGANLWAIGAIPGSLARDPAQVRLFGAPLQTGPEGALQDYALGFRQHLNDLFAPLTGVILAATGFILLVFPAVFHVSLVRPLTSLLGGVRRLENGDYAAQTPVQFADEIGYLTRAFNTLAAELNDLIHNLSAKVQARTAELAEMQAFAEERQLGAEQAQAEAEAASAQLALKVRELAARNEELDAFAHTVAHDIRNPVAQIIGYARLLGEMNALVTPAERAQSLNVIVQASSKLIRILDELLLLAGLRHIEVQPEPVNMAAIVAETRQRLGDVIKQSGAQLETPPEADWPVALGHPAWVEEVWVNYLSNACRYGGDGEQPPRLRLGYERLAPRPESGQVFIRFWLRDLGRGLRPDEQARLFQPFTRLDQARATGHGLGLSIVRNIVEKLGGEVGVESEGLPGRGSCFSFTLPAAPAGSAFRTPTPAEALDQTSLRGLSLLVVDDEALFADSLRDLLTARGGTVLGVAHDGLEAQALTRALQPQLVLMDIHMPRQTGLEAARAIKAAQPQVKIVMLTASEREEDLFEALRAGASGYLLKGALSATFYDQLAALAHGETLLSPGLAERVLAEFARTPALAAPEKVELTDRQHFILERVARGQTYKEIGAELYISEQTVKYQMGQIIDRLHVANRTQAVAYLTRQAKPR